MNVKCANCGGVNLLADEVCKVCGAELHYQPPSWPVNHVIKPFTGAGELIGTTLSVCKDNFWLITKIVFVVMAPFEVFRVLSQDRINDDPELAVGLVALQIFCNVLIVPTLFYALVKVMETGVAAGINEAYRFGASKIPKLAIAAFVSWVVTLFGFMLCIIPGFFAAMVLYLVFPVAVLERGSALDSLRRSYELTEGRRWTILGASLALALVLMVMAIPGWSVSGILVLNGIRFWPLEAAAAIVVDIVMEAGTVMTLVVYLSIMRALESGK